MRKTPRTDDLVSKLDAASAGDLGRRLLINLARQLERDISRASYETALNCAAMPAQVAEQGVDTSYEAEQAILAYAATFKEKA